ncbi:MAG: o-succinylbenzoate synthase [Prevotella sp.]
MKYKINITPKTFHFKQPAGTSRGIYTTRQSWIIEMCKADKSERKGVGECAPLPDLSCDFSHDYEEKLSRLCRQFEEDGNLNDPILREHPSILFGLETALAELNSGSKAFWDNAFSRGEAGIPINGLIWMGSYDDMLQRIEDKLEADFKCIKLKIAAINFDDELALIKGIRRRFSANDVQLRVDANGGFSFDDALYKLELLSQYSIHSIEQPIKAGQWGNMAQLCRESPLPVALDEELIGVNDISMKSHMLNIIKPKYIVLKPSLHGGMKGCTEWIEAAREKRIGTWITSALESNIGLNAIAQFTAHVYGDSICFAQGLGTGSLFADNTEPYTEIRDNKLFFKP